MVGLKFSISAEGLADLAVKKIRAGVDKLAQYPPTVGLNDRFPGWVLFDYEFVLEPNVAHIVFFLQDQGVQEIRQY
jgi:hypothetical protein